MSRYTPASRRRFPVSLPKASAMLAPRSKYVDSKIVDPSIDPTMSHTPYTLVVQAVPRCSIHHTPCWSKLSHVVTYTIHPAGPVQSHVVPYTKHPGGPVQSHVVPYTIHPASKLRDLLYDAPERKITTVRWSNQSDYYPTVIQLQRGYYPTAIHPQRGYHPTAIHPQRAYCPTAIHIQRAYCPTAIHIQRLLPHGNPYTKIIAPRQSIYEELIAPRQFI